MLMIVLLVVIIVALVLIFMVSAKNGIASSSNQVDEAYSTMDVYLKKRHDLIPNLVNVTKGYAKHEKETLDQITNTVRNSNNASSINELMNEEEKVNTAVTKLFNIIQAYPDLKSNNNYINLMNQLQKVEDDIAMARKYYNASVKEFNNKISTFPGSVFAKNVEKKPYFQVSSEAERQNVNVEL